MRTHARAHTAACDAGREGTGRGREQRRGEGGERATVLARRLLLISLLLVVWSLLLHLLPVGGKTDARSKGVVRTNDCQRSPDTRGCQGSFGALSAANGQSRRSDRVFLQKLLSKELEAELADVRRVRDEAMGRLEKRVADLEAEKREWGRRAREEASRAAEKQVRGNDVWICVTVVQACKMGKQVRGARERHTLWMNLLKAMTAMSQVAILL